MAVFGTSSEVRSLQNYSAGRDNNLNLLRFTAALLVLVSHSFALSTGDAATEPLRGLLGRSLGSVAVDVFFVVSGFLVAGSLFSRQNLADFVVARALRIYPGLWVALAVSVTVIGLTVTTTGLAAYFSSTQTWKYLVRNGLVLMGVEHKLPGVFENLPWKEAVNGSLWTLPYELRMYLILAGMWLVAVALRINAVRWVSVACLLLAVLGLAYGTVAEFRRENNYLYSLGGMFFYGAALRVVQSHVPLSGRIAWGMVFVLTFAAAVGPEVFGIAYRYLFPYVVLCVAYLPGGRIRKFNAVGDYSYGLYIYAFPVQQMIAHFWRGVNPYEMTVLAIAVTLPLAMLSWHLVEERAQGLRKTVMKRIGGNAASAPVGTN